MSGLCYALKAKNSSQELKMFIDRQSSGEISITLVGTHKDEYLQLDFDTLSDEDAKDLADYIYLRIPVKVTR